MAAPPPMFSDLFGEATQWDDPVPDYDALILLLGGVAGTATGAAVYDRATTMTGLANLARRSPTLVAFCPSDDNTYIYVGHSLSVYPSDPLNPLGFDGNIITLVGNDPASCQPVALPPTAFSRTDVRAKTKYWRAQEKSQPCLNGRVTAEARLQRVDVSFRKNFNVHIHT